MNQGGGLLLVVLGLAVLFLAVTGKLTALLASVGVGGAALDPSLQNDLDAASQPSNAPYGINPDLGTPRSRPQYDPNTPVRKRTSSTVNTDEAPMFAGLDWPFSSTFSVN